MSQNITKAQEANRAAGAKRAQAFIEDVEWLVTNRSCEHAILVATGYAHKPASLKRKLARVGRHDLIPSIFEWDSTERDRRISK